MCLGRRPWCPRWLSTGYCSPWCLCGARYGSGCPKAPSQSYTKCTCRNFQGSVARDQDLRNRQSCHPWSPGWHWCGHWSQKLPYSRQCAHFRVPLSLSPLRWELPDQLCSSPTFSSQMSSCCPSRLLCKLCHNHLSQSPLCMCSILVGPPRGSLLHPASSPPTLRTASCLPSAP